MTRRTRSAPALRDISKQMMFGRSLAAAAESEDDVLAVKDMLFFVLSQVQESGGDDTHSMQAFADFVKYVESRREMIASLMGSVIMGHIIMGHIIPLLMGVMTDDATKASNRVCPTDIAR